MGDKQTGGPLWFGSMASLQFLQLEAPTGRLRAGRGQNSINTSARLAGAGPSEVQNADSLLAALADTERE